MKAKISALNKNYLVEFKNESEFVSFITQHNEKINNVEVLDEATLPELQKSVEVAKPSMSDGWKTLEKSAFVQKEKGVEKKGMQLGGKYTEFKYEGDKTLDNAADSKVSEPKDDSPAMKGEAPKASSVEEKTETPKAEAPKTEETKSEEPKEESKSEPAEKTEEPKEEKKEEPKSEDKEEKKEEVKEAVNPELNAESEDYKRGYEDGQFAWDCGHYVPAEEADPESPAYEQGYDDGFEDAKEGIDKYAEDEEHHGPFDEEEYTGELEEVMKVAGVQLNEDELDGYEEGDEAGKYEATVAEAADWALHGIVDLQTLKDGEIAPVENRDAIAPLLVKAASIAYGVKEEDVKKIISEHNFLIK